MGCSVLLGNIGCFNLNDTVIRSAPRLQIDQFFFSPRGVSRLRCVSLTYHHDFGTLPGLHN